jgi:hypothetical protein
MEDCSLDRKELQDAGDKINVLNRFLTFFKDLAGQSEEY